MIGEPHPHAAARGYSRPAPDPGCCREFQPIVVQGISADLVLKLTLNQ